MAFAWQCSRCQELLDGASSAVIQHLRAQSRFDLARFHHEIDILPALRSVVKEALERRTAAMETYKLHRAKHLGKDGAGGTRMDNKDRR